MELQLDLALTINPGKGSDPNTDCGNKKKKRCAFSGVDKNIGVPRALIWDQSNRNAEVKDDFVVGWPPVKSWRRRLCDHNRRGCATNYVTVKNSGGGGGAGRGSNSMYVKVKMEGVGIARKVDLSIHLSYQTLAAHLVVLFGKCVENVEEYKLVYQNKEGDWLHARDVPWESLIKSVQRLKLEKNGC